MPTRDRSGAAALMGAAITGLVAFALFLAGGVLLWADGHYRDADGYVSTPSERFTTGAYAITTEDLEVGGGAPGWLLGTERYGTIRLQVTPRGEKPMFVGIARTADVRAYLDGVAHSEVADVEYAPFEADYSPHAGTTRPALPQTTSIWAASSHGDGTRTLTWDVRDGDWSVVVMNEDGSPGVAASVAAGAKLPFLRAVGFGALGGGLLFIAATAALTLYGTRPAPSPRRRAVATTTA